MAKEITEAERQAMKIALGDIRLIDSLIKKRHRYHCGITIEETWNPCVAYIFFESPDGQDYEFYQELRKIGWVEYKKGYRVPYLWSVSKNNIKICYTEHDIIVSPVDFVAHPRKI